MFAILALTFNWRCACYRELKESSAASDPHVFLCIPMEFDKVPQEMPSARLQLRFRISPYQLVCTHTTLKIVWLYLSQVLN